MKVRAFEPGDEGAWDDLVARSLSGTFLHTRRFLAYHEHRFLDLSVCLYDESGLVAVFPAAADPTEVGCVTSHPGATYGGVVHDGRLRGARMIDAVQTVCEYYKGIGLSKIRYKAVPRIYHRAPADDDLYALFRAGAHRYRCDLAAVVDLRNRLDPSRRRRRCLKAALAKNVLVQEDSGRLGDFWPLLEDNLLGKHRVRPVHTFEEIQLLFSRFPMQMRLVIALTAEQMVGGVVLFETPTVLHSQYVCANELGRSVHALDAVLEHCIAAGANGNLRWFSMGISNEDDGAVLNDTLYRYKTEFGAGGVVHEFYQIELQ